MPAVGGSVFDSAGAPVDRELRLYRRDTGAFLGKTRSSGGDGDPHFDKVSLLLHMDGVDGSTTFVENFGAECLPVGAAHISAAQGVYGGSSLALNGSMSGLQVNNTDALNLGVGDFTIEMWVYVTAHTNTAAALLASGGSSWSVGECVLRFDTGSALSLYTYGSGVLVGTESFPTGQWQHVAMCRRVGTVSIYRGGVAVASGSLPGQLNFSTNPQVFLGYSDYDKQSLNGYIDDLRITKGVARYTGNFTPPTEPFAGIAVGRLRAPAPDRARIAASSPVPAHSALSAPPLLARDMEFGGAGRIWGTTKIETSPGSRVPTKARVSIFRGRDKLLAREVWSDQVTGEWAVNGLDTRQDFVVLAQDSAGNYQPVAADKTMPEAQ